jgi:hypothetical protein
VLVDRLGHLKHVQFLTAEDRLQLGRRPRFPVYSLDSEDCASAPFGGWCHARQALESTPCCLSVWVFSKLIDVLLAAVAEENQRFCHAQAFSEVYKIEQFLKP